MADIEDMYNGILTGIIDKFKIDNLTATYPTVNSFSTATYIKMSINYRNVCIHSIFISLKKKLTSSEAFPIVKMRVPEEDIRESVKIVDLALSKGIDIRDYSKVLNKSGLGDAGDFSNPFITYALVLDNRKLVLYDTVFRATSTINKNSLISLLESTDALKSVVDNSTHIYYMDELKGMLKIHNANFLLFYALSHNEYYAINVTENREADEEELKKIITKYEVINIDK